VRAVRAGEETVHIVRDVPDAVFADPRLALIYDQIDGDRADLDHYDTLLGDLGARVVLDVGCGTGEFACRLANRGVDVIGVDPAQASLDIARGKPAAGKVTWILGDSTALPAIVVDAVTMTGNVAQVFVDDETWYATLSSVRKVLREGGHLIFETRDPAFQGWQEWTRDESMSITDTVAGRVEHWVELTEVALPLVSFRQSYRFLDTDDLVTSDSTLRFRDRDEILVALASHGFAVVDVRDAPDRPGREFVFVCRAR
jgi:SAM-dependent methyltransferase